MWTMFGIAMLMTFASGTGCWIALTIKENQWATQADAFIRNLTKLRRQEDLGQLRPSYKKENSSTN